MLLYHGDVEVHRTFIPFGDGRYDILMSFSKSGLGDGTQKETLHESYVVGTTTQERREKAYGNLVELVDVRILCPCQTQRHFQDSSHHRKRVRNF